MRVFIFLNFILLFFSCNNNDHVKDKKESKDTLSTALKIKVPDFNSDSAYQYINTQLLFGPRVPGTPGHAKCFDYFVKELGQAADTIYIQKSGTKTFDSHNIPIYNIIASFNIESRKRILLTAHWDTRPFADQDTKDQDKPISGANDGASGPGILIEIAKKLNEQKPDIGIDIIFFDSEDWGDNSGATEDSYCLGSQYWGKNPHVKNYKADFGINLDMVGAPKANFSYEGYSLSKAGQYLSLVWSSAANLGYQNYFTENKRTYIIDDHYYVMKYTGIPVIDIIDSEPGEIGNWRYYWHTHKDNIDAIDKNTLKAVGQTLLQVIYNY